MGKLRPWLMSAVLCLAAANLARTQETVRIEEHCPYCAMHISKAMQCAFRVKYADGTTVTTCSLHCGARELRAKRGKATQAILVGDYTTWKFTDAERATWVIGGNKPGLMTPRAKWAFANSADAEAFVKQNGGAVATFQEALQAANDDLTAQSEKDKGEKKPLQRVPRP